MLKKIFTMLTLLVLGITFQISSVKNSDNRPSNFLFMHDGDGLDN